MQQLNPHQLDAVRYCDGPLLVLAGAGSGKTAVITHKIAWLIKKKFQPENIVAVTFTNKAAREMQTRVSQLLGNGNANGLRISTFHAMGLRLLREAHQSFGLKSNISILNPEDCQVILRELLRGDKALDNELIRHVQWQISHWKNALLTPEAANNLDIGSAVIDTALRVYKDYEQRLHACNAVDFDDLLLKPVRLLQDDRQLRQRLRDRLHYLLVDEYQDTNRVQYTLVKLLVGDRGCLTVVGDDDQSIYTWRGANPENLHLLDKDFPDLHVIKLEQNYRSTGRILKAANAVIANNPHLFEKKLWSNLGYGEAIRVLQTRNEEHEAEKVISELHFHHLKHKTRYRDYAILFRSNHQSRLFERTLREQRIPYFLSGATSFFDRTEIKDIMAYLRLLTNPDDDNAFLRIINTPRREIGPSTLKKLNQYAADKHLGLLAAAQSPALADRLNARQKTRLAAFTGWFTELADKSETQPPAVTIKELLQEIAYDDWLRETSKDKQHAESRIENVNELAEWFKRLSQRGPQTFHDVVTNMTLIGMLDKDDEADDTDRVSLMTLHAAKGLEFPYVTIVGVEDGILPHTASIDEGRLDEERRLFYVGITRAKCQLTLTFADKRRKLNEIVHCEPSPFLQELPAEDLCWESGPAQAGDQVDKRRGEVYLTNLRGLLGSQ